MKSVRDFKLTVRDLRDWWNAFQLWFTKALRIAIVMVRGAYWMTERRRVLTALGVCVFDQRKNAKVDMARLETYFEALERINQRLEFEEAQIQLLRFGEPESEHHE